MFTQDDSAFDSDGRRRPTRAQYPCRPGAKLWVVDSLFDCKVNGEMILFMTGNVYVMIAERNRIN